MNSICVYCGSADRVDPRYLEAAVEMGVAIARRGLSLWYGAGSTGLMGAVANGALRAGGQVVGVIPKIFHTPKLAHFGLSRLEVVASMHERKQRLADQADAFIALPGGYGTFEELFEILTWSQIGLHQKPVGILNALGYYDGLLSVVENARQQGFIYDEHRALLTSSAYPEELLDLLQNYQPPDGLERWLNRDE
jgi:uncharacterized protein (TIGR00730 family)